MLPQQSDASARRIRRVLDPLVRGAVRESGADRYRERFPAFARVWVPVLHLLSGNSSLRQSHAQLAGDARLHGRLGLDGWVSYSQLARSSTSRPAECFELLLARLLARARSLPRPDPAWRALRRVAVLDSSFLSLSAQLCPWSARGGYAPGLGLQAVYDLAGRIPASLAPTLEGTSDRTALKGLDLSELAGWTLVFDMGYYAHAHFRRLLDAGVSFVTMLQAQAYYEVVRRRRLPELTTPAGDAVLGDHVVRLGSPDNRTGAVLPDMRLVTYRTAAGETFTLLTDRHDLPARDVVMLYRKRWRIEIFFRRFKRSPGTVRPLGHSREAVWLSVLMGAIVTVALSLVRSLKPTSVTDVAWLRALHSSLKPQLKLSG